MKNLAAVFIAALLLASVASGVVYYTYTVTTFRAEIVGPSTVTISGRRLFVNGSPFTVKGVCYSPTPAGEGPDFPWWNASEIYENDFENIRGMGANTIRTYNAGIVYFNDAYYWVYHDDGVPPDSQVYTWHGGGGSFNGQCTEITPPEGVYSFKTTSANWAGWGVFIERPVRDNSGLGNHGTVNGAVTDNSGKIHRALGFNGTNAYISVANSASLNPTRVTVEAWAYFTVQPGTGTQQVIVSKFAGVSWNSSGYQIHIETTSDGQFQIAFGVGPGAYEYGSWAVYQTSFAAGWHHLVGTFDGSTLRLYYDGSQVATASWSGDIASNTYALCVGRKADASSGFFRGIIDEVRVENQAISSAEVSYRYNNGAGRYLEANENTVLLFHFDTPVNIDLSKAGALSFWVKTTSDLKVEIEAPRGVNQTKWISQFGWDGTNNWQEITIPASAWSNLDQVYCPFKITITVSGTFYIDKVRWTGFTPYSDGGIPGGVRILTWGSGYFEARYEGLPEVPEGRRCFIAQPSGSFGGWGLFAMLPHDHTVNLSGASALKFWVRTKENLKVEIEAPKGNIQTKYISDYGWDGTESWQEITIPASQWSNLESVYGLFMITAPQGSTFYVDFVRWENAFPPPQLSILENRNLLDAAWSQRIYVVMGFWVDRSVDFSKTWVRENLKSGFVQMVSRWKNHPAVLMWAFGNEVDVYAGRKENWFSLVQQAAQAAKLVDNNHPITTVNQDITRIGDPSIGSADDNVPSLDIWGANVYYGPSFGDLFQSYGTKSSKPLFLAEWGCDALDARYNVENEWWQARYLENLWDQIADNLSAENENRVCIGGTVFEWSDEWWKAGNWAVHDTLATWANPNYYDYVSGQNNMNEEWWGIMKFTSLESPVKVPREAYYALKEKWS